MGKRSIADGIFASKRDDSMPIYQLQLAEHWLHVYIFDVVLKLVYRVFIAETEMHCACVSLCVCVSVRCVFRFPRDLLIGNQTLSYHIHLI